MTGLEHVAYERARQLEIGWDDKKPNNANQELAGCASAILDDYIYETGNPQDTWPNYRAAHIRDKYGTDYVARLRIAAALIAAEIDRIQSKANATWSSLSLLDVRVNAKGMSMIGDAKRVVDAASRLLNEVDWNVFLADVAEYLNKADDQRFIRLKNAT